MENIVRVPTLNWPADLFTDAIIPEANERFAGYSIRLWPSLRPLTGGISAAVHRAREAVGRIAQYASSERNQYQ
jgi:hypothetical protein